MFLMPSIYEPCGLNQMYSLRYGTVPIVHRTGGLADTVQLWDPDDRSGTGIVFVSVPDGFRSSGAFWRTVTASLASIDFGLVREAQPRTFSFVHASDPHIAPENIERFRHFRRMTDSLSPAFVLMAKTDCASRRPSLRQERRWLACLS